MISKDASCSLAFLRPLLLTIVSITWRAILLLHSILRLIYRQTLSSHSATPTVLVTTGRQAKTLHIVRALKEINCRVIVSDINPVSTSAVSVCCDKFVQLPELNADRLDSWIDHLQQVIVENDIDVVLPVSTINEVLFMGAARSRLQTKLPNVRWFCPDLQTAIQLDDRVCFSAICEQFGVPAPKSGRVTSRSAIPKSDDFEHGLILKRIESTVNRAEEIIPVKKGESIPLSIMPTSGNPWQWQQFVKGPEISAWYVCDEGRVTFSACYHSAPDLVHFDPAPIPMSADKALRRLIAGMRLTGQYAFDMILDKEGNSYVIECNPRASSILEVVSYTPRWAEAFFGHDVSHRAKEQSVGFWFHRNCWPWTTRREGMFKWWDPLPVLAGEVVWPLWAIAERGLKGYTKIDVNICKIIVPGASPARGLERFQREAFGEQLTIMRSALNEIEAVVIDASSEHVGEIVEAVTEAGCKPVLFALHGMEVKYQRDEITGSALPVTTLDASSGQSSLKELVESVLEKHSSMRVVLGADLAAMFGFEWQMTFLSPQPKLPISECFPIPLRRLRLLHVIGSCTSSYYEHLSGVFGFASINGNESARYEHLVAYVHTSGEWSIGHGKGSCARVFSEGMERISASEAISRIDLMGIDVIVPHMFDYEGMTAFRNIFSVLRIPMIGCDAEALALSTNKARTKAVGSFQGVSVPKAQVLKRGMHPDMEYPIIVKPTEEDNSMGITVVRHPSELNDALEEGFKYGDEVLCEEFIEPGREIRAAVLERVDGTLDLLPAIEYVVDAERPIRLSQDKIQTGSDGMPTDLTPIPMTLPAKLDDELREQLLRECSLAHRALGCRDYSLYDFRISQSGKLYMLEASLYCSFSPKSAIVRMAAAGGRGLGRIFGDYCERAYARRRKEGHCDKEQKFGMKAL